MNFAVVKCKFPHSFVLIKVENSDVDHPAPNGLVFPEEETF
jgi:hypothetical protein